ncbi:galactose-3-O-sulfotransferase 2-like [Palaemon carinicauda]|uniref:galactose-3-O-sulfotransferase 2-like n=1 Tax=Palaemon carinicauda TaxID=392227 RepID=UPI0035B57EAA
MARLRHLSILRTTFKCLFCGTTVILVGFLFYDPLIVNFHLKTKFNTPRLSSSAPPITERTTAEGDAGEAQQKDEGRTRPIQLRKEDIRTQGEADKVQEKDANTMARIHDKVCVSTRHVMFLKTHKCGSSTVQNIFLRYSYKNNLTLALPSNGNYLGNPNPFHVGMIPKTLLPKSKLVDIFAVHTRLNYQQLSKVLHRDTKWVTIVREPTALFESLFNFYDMGFYYGFGLENFKDYQIEMLEQIPRFGNKLGRNQMMFDFGYRPDADVKEVRRALDDLDRIFDLVMIAEFMDESLVLLRHLLCWTMEDVVVFTKNARRDKFKRPLDIRTKQVLRTINSADDVLYEHFVSRHMQRVLEFGVEKMAKEVLDLRTQREKYHKKCVSRETRGRDMSLRFMEYSDLVSTYVVSNSSDMDCVLLAMPELALIDHVREAQRSRLNPSD